MSLGVKGLTLVTDKVKLFNLKKSRTAPMVLHLSSVYR